MEDVGRRWYETENRQRKQASHSRFILSHHRSLQPFNYINIHKMWNAFFRFARHVHEGERTSTCVSEAFCLLYVRYLIVCGVCVCVCVCNLQQVFILKHFFRFLLPSVQILLDISYFSSLVFLRVYVFVYVAASIVPLLWYCLQLVWRTQNKETEYNSIWNSISLHCFFVLFSVRFILFFPTSK